MSSVSSDTLMLITPAGINNQYDTWAGGAEKSDDDDAGDDVAPTVATGGGGGGDDVAAKRTSATSAPVLTNRTMAVGWKAATSASGKTYYYKYNLCF